ncbi:M9 family metallopeptidase [Rugamonas rivuli]|uniref:microbial collagenase n=1 Tax=Rugamonas rivuli TaxID=2743358 RepID=A0A843S801_9BURK|nr:M9 family metallopeptidase [Rugamonas rivuli]MQA20565.1 collagenase [Rugamonas rivuli]
MSLSRNILYLGGLCAVSLAVAAHADNGGDPAADKHGRLKQAPMPHQRQTLPPSVEQQKYQLAPTTKPRYDLLPRQQRNSLTPLSATPECKDMTKLATYSGAALADYLVSLPDFECTYGLFSLTPAQGATVYSDANLSAIASRFTQEAGSYNASNMALVNLALYLRAGYYLAEGGTIAQPAQSVKTTLRTPIKQLAESTRLYAPNAVAYTTAGETLRLITNMHDEAFYLPSMKALVQRYTNSANTPNAVDGLRNASASGGFTSALTVLFYSHFRPDAAPVVQNDLSYATALNNFVISNKTALLGGDYSYQLNDATNEAFRFMQYPALKAGVKPMVLNMLATTSLTSADSDLWLAAASAVKYYDNENCAQYGTCDFTTKLANAILKYSKSCSPTLRIRAQDMTPAQMQDSCDKLATEENYAHEMLKTKRIPVANDNNTSLELVVFDDYTNYSKYASIIYGISTDNGGMYLEGEPDVPGNQARFIAHEASWLRPTFQVWNLEHEYVHYLDGRFDMLGDFGQATSVPTVWWIEGIAEYLSLKNNNQVAIDITKTGTYRLSQIFGNTYSMNDYVIRAYRWGYMATRFMMERHRADVDAVLGMFRIGDYSGYQSFMARIGTSYDAEFADWVNSATTAGQPPMPEPQLPACASTSYLGKNCGIGGLGSSTAAYVYLMVPAGATNVKIFSRGGSGDADMYVALDRYPTVASYDMVSAAAGNSENVSIANPVAGHWYYIMLKAKTSFSGVTVYATYD